MSRIVFERAVPVLSSSPITLGTLPIGSLFRLADEPLAPSVTEVGGVWLVVDDAIFEQPAGYVRVLNLKTSVVHDRLATEEVVSVRAKFLYQGDA